jgi:hypothetical protein
LASRDLFNSNHGGLVRGGIDGVRWAACKPGGELPLHTAGLADGYRELRILAVAPPPTESQGRAIIPIEVNNHDGK